MGPSNWQNQHFAELRQKVCSSMHGVVRHRGLPSLNGKLERFVTKKIKKSGCHSSPTDYIATEIFVRPDAELTAMISRMHVRHKNLNQS